MVKVAFNFKSQGIGNIFSQGTVDCQNSKQASLIIVDPDMQKFAVGL